MAESLSSRLSKEFTLKRLTFWIFWFGSHIFLFILGYLKQKDDPSLDNLNVLGLSVWTSRGAGLCLAYDGSLILLPVLRNIIKYLRALSFLNKLIPFDENLWFHRQTAYAMLFWTLVHVFAHYVNFWRLEQLGKFQAWQLHYTTWAGLTGHFMLLIMLLMYTSAHHKMRHQSFETFWYTHHLAFFFMFCLFFHGHGCFVKTAEGVCKGYLSWRFTIIGGILYFFERVLREIRARQATKITKVIDHPSKAVEIQFDKPSFRYKAGQYLFLNIPAISTWQWHPFTITSAPDDPFVSIHVRQVGDFTNKLGELLGCNSNNSNFDIKRTLPAVLPTLRIDGPYGAPAEDVFKNEIVVLIGCGIGVTPFASILKNIWHQQQNKRLLKLKRVEFFWICRETGAFEWFQSLLKTLEATQMEAGFLKFHIYLTSKLRESTINNIIINDVSGSYDPLTDLESRTHYGRPNFGYIFSQLNRAIESGRYLPGKEGDLNTNVGVYYCGPPALAKSLKKDCDSANTEGIKFNFHKENF
ncbi:19469_t:CDS:2 [Dentiscutata erythropus]|uniref:19469_t:CDS:1 n=1 Tax=Dentiscutata erythropus TaxID=1348616 RepID=A0A9N8W6B8_9GLOM|nr:19469_t:CDS:2 [Dentiscutata erythropus]